MAGKEKDFDTINDGSHAIRKFNFVDILIIVILVILWCYRYRCCCCRPQCRL